MKKYFILFLIILFAYQVNSQTTIEKYFLNSGSRDFNSYKFQSNDSRHTDITKVENILAGINNRSISLRLKNYSESFIDSFLNVIPEYENIKYFTFISSDLINLISNNKINIKKNDATFRNVKCLQIKGIKGGDIEKFKNLRKYFPDIQYLVLESQDFLSYAPEKSLLKNMKGLYLKNIHLGFELSQKYPLNILRLEGKFKENVKEMMLAFENFNGLERLHLIFGENSFSKDKEDHPDIVLFENSESCKNLIELFVLGPDRLVFDNFKHLKKIESITLNCHYGYKEVFELPGFVFNLPELKFLKLNSQVNGFKIPENINPIQLEELDIHLSKEQSHGLNKFLNLKSLKLYNVTRNIKQLPESIIGLNKLEALYINCQSLSDLGPHVMQLQNLKSLNIRKGKFTAFPIELYEMDSLEYITINETNIEVIPSGIGRLKNIVSLDFNSNRIKVIPEDIDLLNKLKVLKLSENEIENLPGSLLQCKSLKNLDLSENHISIPAIEVIQKIKSDSIEINLSDCQLSFLPDDGWNAIQCKVLNLSRNNIRVIPESILSANILELNVERNPIGYHGSLETDLGKQLYLFLSGQLKIENLEINKAMLTTIDNSRINSSNPRLIPLFDEIVNQKPKGYLEYIYTFSYVDYLIENKRYQLCFELLDHNLKINPESVVGHFVQEFFLTRTFVALKLKAHEKIKSSATELFEQAENLIQHYDADNCVTYKFPVVNLVNVVILLNSAEEYKKADIIKKRILTFLQEGQDLPINEIVSFDLLELYLVFDMKKEFDDYFLLFDNTDDWSEGNKIILQYFNILDEILKGRNVDSIIVEYENDLSLKKSQIDWNCILVDKWAELKSKELSEKVSHLNDIICPGK